MGELDVIKPKRFEILLYNIGVPNTLTCAGGGRHAGAS